AVADGGDLAVDVLAEEPADVAHAPAVDADHGDPQLVGPVVGGRRGLRECAGAGAEGRSRGGDDGGTFQEFTTAEDVHWQLREGPRGMGKGAGGVVRDRVSVI